MDWLRRRLELRRAHPVLRRRRLAGPVMRVDAKAEGEHIAVGGWRPVRDDSGSISTLLSPWFSLRLSEEQAPWAFVKGAPSR
eukprot:11053535-Lingulodinium_polyedra.AAC.1